MHKLLATGFVHNNFAQACSRTRQVFYNLQVERTTRQHKLHGRPCRIQKIVLTSLSCRREIRATRCVTPIVLYTKVDTQCDKLATDDRRQFIILNIRLS